MPTKEPQLKGNRKESLAVFSQVHHSNLKNDPKKCVLDSCLELEESSSSSVITSSFRNALKESENQVILIF